jgi:hypothetical protein
MLLARGADVNAQGEGLGNALQAASALAQTNAVRPAGLCFARNGKVFP